MFCRLNTTKSPPEAARPLSAKASARPLPPNRWKWCASSKAGNYHTAPRATARSSISARPRRRCGRKTTVPFRFHRPTTTIPAARAAERQTGAKQRAIGFQHIQALHLSSAEKSISANHVFVHFAAGLPCFLSAFQVQAAFTVLPNVQKAACTFKMPGIQPFLARAGAHAFLHGFGFFARTHFRHHHFVALYQA